MEKLSTLDSKNENLDITSDFISQLQDSAQKMNWIINSKKWIISSTKLSLAILKYQYPLVNKWLVGIVRTLLWKYKLPDISNQDLDKLDSKVLEELVYNFIPFYNVYSNTRTTGSRNLKSSRYKRFKDTWVKIGDKNYNYDVTGNVLWWFAWAAGGLSVKLLKQMAWIAQKQMWTSNKSSTREGSYYDDVRDQHSIDVWYKLFQSYKNKWIITKQELNKLMLNWF